MPRDVTESIASSTACGPAGIAKSIFFFLPRIFTSILVRLQEQAA
jgi:hypothetical protein